MKEKEKHIMREFLQDASRLATAAALVNTAIPHVHLAGTGSIRLALIDCGGRRNGPVANAFVKDLNLYKVYS